MNGDAPGVSAPGVSAQNGEPGAPGPVLVIKLGALGDFVQALGPCAAIRRHHAGARITLLTTAPFAPLAEASGYFDAVWIDERPRPWHVGVWLALRRRLRGGGFTRVYDLQTSDRSSFYLRLLAPGPRPEWSGIAAGCSHPHANPRRDTMHTVERQAEQLAMAGLQGVVPDDLAWAPADAGCTERFAIARPYVLLVPGGAAHRPAKRWPADRYAAAARRLTGDGVTPVLLGGPEESGLLAAIEAGAPGARNLAGATGHLDIIALAREATAALGNDTGPMHLIAAAGCPSVVLYSAASDPALCAQRGAAVTILPSADLGELDADTVAQALAQAAR